MIVSRYLIREIFRHLVIVLGVLTILFTSYGAARFLSHAVNGLLPPDMIVQMVGLRTLIALDVLIPISLYLSVVLAFGRMWGDSEFVAMMALGLAPARVMAVVIAFATCIALIVGGLSLAVRPRAYARSHELSNRAAASLNINGMHAGTFYVDSRASRVIFIGRRPDRTAPGHDVFVQFRLGSGTRIIHARSARQLSQANRGGSEIHFTDAHIYEIGRGGGAGDLVLNVKDLLLRLGAPHITPPGYSSLVASTAHLAASHSAADAAEFQWRLSTCCSTLLLAMLAVPLSHSGPRQRKYARIGIAIALYFGYYFLCGSLRKWVENGVIPAFPGIWWAQALLAVVLLAALFEPKLKLRRKRT